MILVCIAGIILQRAVNSAEVLKGDVQAKHGPKFSHFFAAPFVSRVRPGICIRTVRFWVRTIDVQIFAALGSPKAPTGSVLSIREVLQLASRPSPFRALLQEHQTTRAAVRRRVFVLD